MVIARRPHLHSGPKGNGQDGRIRIPLQNNVYTGSKQTLGGAESELAMPQTVPLKEDNVNVVTETLNASHQIASRAPAQGSLEAIHRLAHAVKLAITGVDPYEPAGDGLNSADGNIRAISPPADTCPAVIVGTSVSLVHFLWNGWIPQGFRFCTLALELGFLFAPANTDVLGRRQVGRGHGNLSDGIESPAHEDNRIGLGCEDEELFVW